MFNFLFRSPRLLVKYINSKIIFLNMSVFLPCLSKFEIWYPQIMFCFWINTIQMFHRTQTVAVRSYRKGTDRQTRIGKCTCPWFCLRSLKDISQIVTYLCIKREKFYILFLSETVDARRQSQSEDMFSR